MGVCGTPTDRAIFPTRAATLSSYDELDLDLATTARDSSGISRVRLLVDGALVATDLGNCRDETPTPCPNRNDSWPLSRSRFNTDGRHTLTVEGTDAAGNTSASTTACVS